MNRACLVALALFAVGAMVSAQTPPDGAERPTYRAMVPGWGLPFQVFGLLKIEAILEELDVTAAQKERQTAIYERHRDKIRAVNELTDHEKARQARQAAWDEMETALMKNLDPQQRDRLDQVKLQVQGPFAFQLEELPNRLDLSEDERKKIAALADEAREALRAASVVPFANPDDKPTTIEAVEQFVRTAEFAEAKAKAWPAFIATRAASVAKIEETLTEPQRAAYRQMLGKPFDLEKLRPKDESIEDDIRVVAGSLGLLGQRSDPNFDVTVARPVYTDTHPRVLFDEAHHNFHTAAGRYKAFAELMTNDGYRITPNTKSFTAEMLAAYEILIVANALGAEWTNDGEAAKSAFSSAECEAIEAWVRGGGALLLVTDHEPFGSAADELAKRFGVSMSKLTTSDPANQTDGGLLFAREKGLIGDHPIMRGRDASEQVNRVLTFTGQSLLGPPDSVALLKFADTAVDHGRNVSNSAAGRAQGIAFRHGGGRVVVMGEAAQLSAQVAGYPPSAFGMNLPACDNRQMALNIMHWLSGLIE